MGAFFFGHNQLFEGLGYGYLYNWHTIDGNETNLINDLRASTNADWSTLSTYLGGDTVSGGKLKESGTERWDSPNTGATNLYNFTAIPNGARTSVGTFVSLGSICYTWTSTIAITNPWHRSMIYTSDDLSDNFGFDDKHGLSIRCVRDLTAQEQIDYSDGDIVESKTDYNGNSYDVVRIGTQGWTTTNLKARNLLDGTSIPNVTDNTAWSNLTTLGRCAYSNDQSNV